MIHPLKCPICREYRFIEFEGVKFEDDNKKKGFGVKMPIFKCANCGQFNSILPQENFLKLKDVIMPSINEGEFIDMPLKYIFSKIDPDRRFKHFDHLGFEYDPRDNYLIPGLYREWDDGYLTPVFFNKDLLLYYNNHPDYSVRLTSFSSGNIYFKGKQMFDWGFGINRNNRLFMWLGDLEKEFKDSAMNSHLKRFQASNVESDHDVVSKFYLSQNPFSYKDAFQTSDNESILFRLSNDFNTLFSKKYGIELIKVDIEKLAEYYKSPILEEREQIFNAYLSLNKYFVENLKEQNLRELLLKHGLHKDDLERDGRKLGTLKLLTLFLDKVFCKSKPDKIMTPLFVLNDLRQLHGHLSDKNFKSEYESCKDRLGLAKDVTDFAVYETLISSMIMLFQTLLDASEECYQ